MQLLTFLAIVSCARPTSCLWRHLGELIDARPDGAIRFVKVLGHASAQSVLEGLSTHEDKYGNDCADALATAGAHMRMEIDSERESFGRTVLATKAVQHMMMDIALAREKQRRSAVASASSSSSSHTDSDSPSDSDTSVASSSSFSDIVSRTSRTTPRRTRGRAAPSAPE